MLPIVLKSIYFLIIICIVEGYGRAQYIRGQLEVIERMTKDEIEREKLSE